MSNKTLNKSVESAWLNIFVSIFFRFFTFFVNAYILRHVTGDILGINVRTVLLFDTILFLSREAFRKSCLSKPENGDWRGTINLIWMGVPIGIVTSIGLSYIWIYKFQMPDEIYADQYISAVKIVCLNSIIILISETVYIVSQVFLHVRFRSAVELFYLCFNATLQCLVVMNWPDKVILYYAYAGTLNACLYLIINLYYMHIILKKQIIDKKKTDDNEDGIPFDSIWQFFPDLKAFRIDKKRWELSLGFFKQGFLKQLLTEGEKYMFTWFNLMAISDQGIYDVVASLGSIPARLVFSKIEESAHLYFSQTVSRGDKVDLSKEKDPSRHLNILLKALVLVGFIVIAFGISYSHLLLHLYGGELLSSGIGPTLLRLHCFYIMFLAFNGVTECYAFSVMTEDQVSKYNYKMALMTAIFLGCTLIFANIFGPSGFIIANICNFLMRIGHNVKVISKRFQNETETPLTGLLPSLSTLVILMISAFVCQASELYIYKQSVLSWFLHLSIGAFMFLTSCGWIFFKEKWLRSFIKR